LFDASKAETVREGNQMKIHAPSETIFWSAVALIVLSLFGHFYPDGGFLTQYQFWISITASIVIVLGCVT
jgi:hypothetical protein